MKSTTYFKQTLDRNQNDTLDCFKYLIDYTYFLYGDYFDADHLSDVGAKKLSLIMNEVIEQNKMSEEK